MTPMLKKILDMTAQQENVPPLFREGVRLAGLEDTIMTARPDYCEAAESILSPMMAALRKRYEFGEHRQEWADVEHASEKLFQALMAADQAEES